jgi:vacuolar-type H+-ATPase subunit D/Vma8
MNPNNNKHFNDEALRINRTLKKENDALKLEIKSLWTDLSEVEKQLAKYLSATEFNNKDDEYADKGMSRGDFISKEYTQ